MKSLITLLLLITNISVAKATSKSLEYISSTQAGPTQVMQQVYFVNKFYSFSYVPQSHQPKGLFTIIKKGVHQTFGLQFERYMNFSYAAPIKAKDLILIKTGKDRGISILITDYNDSDRYSTIQAWLPQLRKVRRVSEPLADDSWFGTNFTQGDMKLRWPKDENHEIIANKTFNSCAQGINISKKSKWHNYTQGQMPCVSKGKKVLVLKSTPSSSYPADYDYRISYVDSVTYADYRVEYYQNDKLVKEVEKNWLPVEMPMPRAQIFSHWFVKYHKTGSESLLIMMPLEKATSPEMWTDSF